jgi:Flp pilus assembly protein TadG
MNRDTLKPNRKLARHRGGAVLEMAITGILLCMITFGAVEGGWYFYCKNIMQGAAREGVRAGIVPPPTGVTATTAVMNAIANELNIAKINTGTTSYTGTGPFTLGNYTVDFGDYNPTLATIAYSQSTPPTSSSVSRSGDGFVVKITATWSVIGTPFRPMQLIPGTHTVLASAMMRMEY